MLWVMLLIWNKTPKHPDVLSLSLLKSSNCFTYAYLTTIAGYIVHYIFLTDYIFVTAVVYQLQSMHTHTHTHTCKLQIFLQPLMVMRKAGTVSRAKNSQGNRPFLTASGVGTQSPTWTIAVSWEKALNLHPSKCQVLKQLGGLVGLVRGRWNIRWKNARVNSGPQTVSQGHNHYTTQPHTHATAISNQVKLRHSSMQASNYKL